MVVHKKSVVLRREASRHVVMCRGAPRGAAQRSVTLRQSHDNKPVALRDETVRRGETSSVAQIYSLIASIPLAIDSGTGLDNAFDATMTCSSFLAAFSR